MQTLKAIQKRVQALRLPKLLLMNNVGLSAKHLDEVLAENEVERQWYRHVPPFEDIESIFDAFDREELATVNATDNYLPIMRYRNPKLVETYPPYLTVDTKKLLDEVTVAWRKHLRESGLDPKIKLAVTSLVRTRSYQLTIVAAGKLADPDSPHTRGEAFDIDASGYYLDETPINARSQVHNNFHQAFQKMKAEMPKPEYGDYALYNPEVHKLLKVVLKEMADQDKLHFVHEYPGTTNACLHVCRNPAYQPTTRG